MKQRTGTCTDEIYWQAVAEIGWGTKTTDSRAVEAAILKSWDNEFIYTFDRRTAALRQELSAKVERYEDLNDVSCGCGDDGFSDLINHVVGLGKEVYEAAMADPMLVVKRGRAYDYVESFSYCIPFVAKATVEKKEMTFEQAMEKVRVLFGQSYEEEDEDFDLYLKSEALSLMLGPKAKADPRHYMFWAQRELPNLRALKASPFADELCPLLDDILVVIEKVGAGDVSDLTNYPGLKDKVKELREKQSQILEQKRAELVILGSRGWSLDNMVSEAGEFLGVS